jgi:sodium/hydrogen exchanger 8
MMGLGLGDPPADYGSIAAVGLFVALMCVCIVVGHLLEENRWMNESTTALLIVSPSPSYIMTSLSSLFFCVCVCVAASFR